MSRSLAREFGPDKIRVNALAPGWVMTDKQRDLWVTPEALAAHLERQCLKEELLPQTSLTRCCLSSRTSRMMTGQVVVVDGGTVVTG